MGKPTPKIGALGSGSWPEASCAPPSGNRLHAVDALAARRHRLSMLKFGDHIHNGLDRYRPIGTRFTDNMPFISPRGMDKFLSTIGSFNLTRTVGARTGRNLRPAGTVAGPGTIRGSPERVGRPSVPHQSTQQDRKKCR